MSIWGNVGLLMTAASWVGLVGCAGSAPDESGPGFQITVAPLTLTGVTDGTYNLKVYNSDAVFDATTLVWSADGVTSTQYGDSQGAISYVGPCDASAQTDNTVELVTVSFTGAGDFQLPCPEASPCRISKPCTENADALVQFNLTVMRNANQGFFDVAVNFEDIFCSAKVDCLSEGLLHDATGERKATVVAGLACTGGPGAEGSVLLFDDLALTCDDGALSATISTEPTAGAGNQLAPALDAEDAGVSVYQVGIYQGAEQLDCGVDGNGDPVSCQKVYSNTAIGLGAAAFGATCTLTGKATAGSGDFASPTPGNAAYPVININVQLTDGTGSGLTCGTNPLNDGTPPAGATPGTGCYAVPPTGVCTGYTDLSDPAGTAFAHRYPSSPGGPTAPSGFTCEEGTTICRNAETGEVFVPAGDFWMGCNSVLDSDCQSEESPQHRVTLSAYAIDSTEVTAAEYKACVTASATGCTVPSTTGTSDWVYETYAAMDKQDHPINFVNWAQASAYCAWSGKAAGIQRLCTEAEWEKAARGGCDTVTGDCGDGSQMRKYPWDAGDGSAAVEPTCYNGLANFHDCVDSTTAVGAYPMGMSPYGAYDMAGNEYEWVSDWWGQRYSGGNATDPTGPTTGSYRVCRGGYFRTPAVLVRASLRIYREPPHAYIDLGFRCCRSVP